MAYIISERARKIMRTFYHDNGNNSFFALLEKDGNLYLFKFFDCFRDELCEKLRIIERFKDLKYNGLNAFPLDSFLLEDEMNECPENGYVCKYYKDAHDFKDLMYNEMVQSIPYPVRYQATLDISKQLAFIHELGFIYNDMRFSNCMISPQLGHGFLVDFEDMILEDEFKIKKSYYRFTDKDTNNKLSLIKMNGSY
jgi:serine/threonine protein kinase